MAAGLLFWECWIFLWNTHLSLHWLLSKTGGMIVSALPGLHPHYKPLWAAGAVGQQAAGTPQPLCTVASCAVGFSIVRLEAYIIDIRLCKHALCILASPWSAQLSLKEKSAHLPSKTQQWRATGFGQPRATYTLNIKAIPEFRANYLIMENEAPSRCAFHLGS